MFVDIGAGGLEDEVIERIEETVCDGEEPQTAVGAKPLAETAPLGRGGWPVRIRYEMAPRPKTARCRGIGALPPCTGGRTGLRLVQVRRAATRITDWQTAARDFDSNATFFRSVGGSALDAALIEDAARVYLAQKTDQS